MSACPASSLISTRMACLPRLQLANSEEMPPLLSPMYLMGSPMLSGSTLITRAPCSHICMAAKEAVIIVENSKIVTPSRGFIICPLVRVSSQH